MCLTFWKRADRSALVHDEVRQVDQKPEAFGEQTGEQLVRFLKMQYNGTTQVQTGTGATYSQEVTSAHRSISC